MSLPLPLPLASSRKLLNIKPFVFFSIIMIFKSYLAWMTIFDNVYPWSPLLKELPFIWLIFCLIERFATKHKMAVYWAANLLLSAIFFAAIMYYKYFGIIVTYHMISQVGQVGEVKNSVFFILDPYYLLIFLDLILIGIWLLRNRKTPKLQKMNSLNTGRFKVAALFALSVVLIIVNIVPNQASMNELKKTEQMGILGYETYTVLADNQEQSLVDSREITQDKIDGLKKLQPVENPQYWQSASGKNIIIIQMESFQNFLINLKIDGQEITPVINQLANQNLYFPHFYQQVGQGNTSDAEYVVNTSLYVPLHGPATQLYAGKDLPSLPKLLQSQGYFTATFHTNMVEFWNRSELYRALGFDKYYDQTFFGEDDIIAFASSDEVLYKKTSAELKRLSEKGQPFYAQVISMSAHHPFFLPEEKERIQLPERYQDTFVGNYLTAQNYADYALGQFIEELKANGLWDNSLLVIYGDHQGLPIYSLSKDDTALMEEIYNHQYNQVNMVNIPLIIASPDIQPQVIEIVGGQSDILPTVANLTGISLDKYLHFGQDLLNQTNSLLPERYYLPTGSFLNNEGLFIPGIGYEDGTFQSIHQDDKNKNETAREREDNEDTTQQEYDNALELLHLSDSYVSQLPDLEPAAEDLDTDFSTSP